MSIAHSNEIRQRALAIAARQGSLEAARLTGVSDSTVRNWMRTARVRSPFFHSAGNRQYDAELAILQALFPGQPVPQNAIAEACGVSRETISQLEKRALRKIRHRLIDEGLFRETA